MSPMWQAEQFRERSTLVFLLRPSHSIGLCRLCACKPASLSLSYFFLFFCFFFAGWDFFRFLSRYLSIFISLWIPIQFPSDFASPEIHLGVHKWKFRWQCCRWIQNSWLVFRNSNLDSSPSSTKTKKGEFTDRYRYGDEWDNINLHKNKTNWMQCCYR